MEQQQVCRICLQPGQLWNNVCSCKGALGLVHSQCLLQYFDYRQMDELICQICNCPYRLSISYNQFYSCQSLCELQTYSHYWMQILVVVICTIVSGLLLSATIYKLIKREMKMVMILGMVTGFCCMIVFYALKVCCRTALWKQCIDIEQQMSECSSQQKIIHIR